MKKKQSREKAAPVQDKDLVSAKGSSGYPQIRFQPIPECFSGPIRLRIKFPDKVPANS